MGICAAVAGLVILVFAAHMVGGWIYIYKSRHVRRPLTLWRRNVKEAELKRLKAEAANKNGVLVEIPKEEDWLTRLRRERAEAEAAAARAADPENAAELQGVQVDNGHPQQIDAPGKKRRKGKRGPLENYEMINAAEMILTNYREARRQFKRFSDKNVVRYRFHALTEKACRCLFPRHFSRYLTRPGRLRAGDRALPALLLLPLCFQACAPAQVGTLSCALAVSLSAESTLREETDAPLTPLFLFLSAECIDFFGCRLVGDKWCVLSLQVEMTDDTVKSSGSGRRFCLESLTPSMQTCSQVPHTGHASRVLHAGVVRSVGVALLTCDPSAQCFRIPPKFVTSHSVREHLRAGTSTATRRVSSF